MLPGLANAPSEAALEERGFAVEGLAEFWAAAAAAAKVARFCNCRALIPGERSQRGWCQTWGGRLRRGWVAGLHRDGADMTGSTPRVFCCLRAARVKTNREHVPGVFKAVEAAAACWCCAVD